MDPILRSNNFSNSDKFDNYFEHLEQEAVCVESTEDGGYYYDYSKPVLNDALISLVRLAAWRALPDKERDCYTPILVDEKIQIIAKRKLSLIKSKANSLAQKHQLSVFEFSLRKLNQVELDKLKVSSRTPVAWFFVELGECLEPKRLSPFFHWVLITPMKIFPCFVNTTCKELADAMETNTLRNLDDVELHPAPLKLLDKEIFVSIEDNQLVNCSFYWFVSGVETTELQDLHKADISMYTLPKPQDRLKPPLRAIIDRRGAVGQREIYKQQEKTELIALLLSTSLNEDN